jgi:hypothetical protein
MEPDSSDVRRRHTALFDARRVHIHMNSVRATGAIAVIALCVLALPPTSEAGSTKKAIWGPMKVDGVSQFPIYEHLGAGIYAASVSWYDVAPTRPSQPRNPRDPAYRWSPDIDYAISQGRKHGIKVALTISGSPPWANGGRAPEWAPKHPGDFAAFAEAIARRYPAVHRWQIWGEPNRQGNFMPLAYVRHKAWKPLTRKQSNGPRLYARILDAAYGALKRVNKANKVIGGNTYTVGDITTREFISAMRLPNGRKPRMDMWGHNPFSTRKPDLKKDGYGWGFADFSDLDDVVGWLDRWQRRKGRRLHLFLAEFTVPTDHQNYEFNFWVDRKTQAKWVTAALRITRRWKRINTLGWLSLYDEPPNATHDEVRRGLLDYRGRKKPSYRAYRRG